MALWSGPARRWGSGYGERWGYSDGPRNTSSARTGKFVSLPAIDLRPDLGAILLLRKLAHLYFSNALQFLQTD
jgi:hypothetical protein